HTPNFIFATQDVSRRLADFVQARNGNHLFVRGDLKDRIGGSIDDGLACADVLLAKLLDDLRARGRNVAENAGNICLFDKAVNNLRRKALRVSREGMFENDSGHLPMPGRGVLAVGAQSTPTETSARIRNGRKIL